MNNKEQLLNAFVRKATTYNISVRNSEMLPSKLKRKKELAFTIKPPTMYVLSLCASILNEIPDKLYETENIDLNKALDYQTHMAEVLSVLSYESDDYPDWYVDFLIKNLSIIELLQIMQETSLKCNPSFFLSCFQIAKVSNPMTINHSTLTDL